MKAGRYGKNLHRRRPKEQLRVRKAKRQATYRFVEAGWLRVGNLGPLHVALSRKEGEEKLPGIVTADPELSAAQVVGAYTERWSIEVFFKDLQERLGFGQYQSGSYRAAVTHLHLVCFGYALLTHLPVEDAQGKRKGERAATTSASKAQNAPRRLVWRDLEAYLETLPTGEPVTKEPERVLVA